MALPKISRQIFKLISKKSSFQKKKILNFHRKLSQKNLKENEDYLKIYKIFLAKNKIKIVDAVNSYIEMCAGNPDVRAGGGLLRLLAGAQICSDVILSF